METSHFLPLREALDRGSRYGAAYGPLYRWCASLVTRVDGVAYGGGEALSWQDLDETDRVYLLETMLSTEDVGHFALHIRACVALPDDLVRSIEEVVYIQATGGCECMECSRRGTNRDPSWCRYHSFEDDRGDETVVVRLREDAFGYVSRHVHHRDEPVLTLPYEFAQVKGAISRGIGRGQRDRNPKTGKPSTHNRERAQEMLRQAGIL